MTFDIRADIMVRERHGWLSYHEAAVVCRRCKQFSVMKLTLRSIDYKQKFREAGSISKEGGDVEQMLKPEGFIDVSDIHGRAEAPEHLPDDIRAGFEEGATCLAVGCHNAAAAMFRLALDLTTKPLLPDPDDAAVAQPTKFQRFNLRHRIKWLIAQGLLPVALEDVLYCLREDGNAGAHDGTVDLEAATDLLDFSIMVLERQFTEPERIRLAKERIEKRRTPPPAAAAG